MTSAGNLSISNYIYIVLGGLFMVLLRQWFMFTSNVRTAHPHLCMQNTYLLRNKYHFFVLPGVSGVGRRHPHSVVWEAIQSQPLQSRSLLGEGVAAIF